VKDYPTAKTHHSDLVNDKSLPHNLGIAEDVLQQLTHKDKAVVRGCYFANGNQNECDKFNVIVHSKASHQHQVRVPNQVNQGDYVRFCRSITLSIAPGEYVLGFALVTIQPDDYARIDELPQMEFNHSIKICDVYEKVGIFYVAPHYSFNHHSHFGLCNLPGDCQIHVIANCKQ
jgi:hypothetical protein